MLAALTISDLSSRLIWIRSVVPAKVLALSTGLISLTPALLQGISSPQLSQPLRKALRLMLVVRNRRALPEAESARLFRRRWTPAFGPSWKRSIGPNLADHLICPVFSTGKIKSKRETQRKSRSLTSSPRVRRVGSTTLQMSPLERLILVMYPQIFSSSTKTFRKPINQPHIVPAMWRD